MRKVWKINTKIGHPLRRGPLETVHFIMAKPTSFTKTAKPSLEQVSFVLPRIIHFIKWQKT